MAAISMFLEVKKSATLLQSVGAQEGQKKKNTSETENAVVSGNADWIKQRQYWTVLTVWEAFHDRLRQKQTSVIEHV